MNIHFPADGDMLKKAQFRLKFEELFFIQLDLLNRKLIKTEKVKGKVVTHIGEHFNNFYKHHLPFQLTGAQKKY